MVLLTITAPPFPTGLHAGRTGQQQWADTLDFLSPPPPTLESKFRTHRGGREGVREWGRWWTTHSLTAFLKGETTSGVALQTNSPSSTHALPSPSHLRGFVGLALANEPASQCTLSRRRLRDPSSERLWGRGHLCRILKPPPVKCDPALQPLPACVCAPRRSHLKPTNRIATTPHLFSATYVGGRLRSSRF